MKKYQYIISIFIIIFCCNLTESASAWVKSISVKRKDADVQCSPGAISIGIEDTANSDLAPPPTPNYQCYIKINAEPNALLEMVVTDPYTKHCWNVELSPFPEYGPPIQQTSTLTWNFSDISGNIELREGLNSCESGTVLIDMKEETSVDIPGNFENYIQKPSFVTIVYTNDSNSGQNSQVETQTIDLSPGWNLITVPLVLNSYLLDNVIGEQLPGGCFQNLSNMVLYFNASTQKYEKAWFCGNCNYGDAFDNHWLKNDWSPSDLTLELGKGAWLLNRTGDSQSFSITGQTLDEDISINIETGWQILGIPKNLPVNIGDIGVPAAGDCYESSADRIQSWNPVTQNFTKIWFCECNDTGWEPFTNRWLNKNYSQSNFVLNPGEAVWFKNEHSSFTWTINSQ
ncbi:secreted protein [Candidatus Magnetomorum sp. HK-1]|nr:secreted protein [Candidatus Magnetomorum sp. HK-1]